MEAKKTAVAILLEDLAMQRLTAHLALEQAEQLSLQLRAALAGVQQQPARRRLDFAMRISAMLDAVEQERSFLRRLCDALAVHVGYYGSLTTPTRSQPTAGRPAGVAR